MKTNNGIQDTCATLKDNFGAWYDSCSAQSGKSIQRVLKTAQQMTPPLRSSVSNVSSRQNHSLLFELWKNTQFNVIFAQSSCYVLSKSVFFFSVLWTKTTINCLICTSTFHSPTIALFNYFFSLSIFIETSILLLM